LDLTFLQPTSHTNGKITCFFNLEGFFNVVDNFSGTQLSCFSFLRTQCRTGITKVVPGRGSGS